MRVSDLHVLYEDNHLLVLAKPVGIATMGLPEGEQTLLTVAKDYIREKYDKPGNVYLGVVSRIDTPVSGVVLFARTSKAADRINEQFRNRSVEKLYSAIVEGTIEPRNDTCIDRICEDKRHRRVWIAGQSRRVINPEGKEAILSYRFVRKAGAHSLIEITLGTGRKHQIRLQLSSRGFPILGDHKYGSKVKILSGITLHAQTLTIDHPTTAERMSFTAPLPDFWNKWLQKSEQEAYPPSEPRP